MSDRVIVEGLHVDCERPVLWGREVGTGRLILLNDYDDGRAATMGTFDGVEFVKVGEHRNGTPSVRRVVQGGRPLHGRRYRRHACPT